MARRMVRGSFVRGFAPLLLGLVLMVPALAVPAMVLALAPDAPTIGTATGGNASATVTWTAPGSDGGATIDSYTVTASDGTSTCVWTTGPLSCSVSGLTNGTSYTFTVTAHNADGNGLSSAPSNAVTPSTMPGAPTIGTATGGNASATVSWTAPADNGGLTIDSYTVTSSPDGKTCTWSTGPLSCSVSGLTNGTSYTFTVTAHNTDGNSDPSAPSNAVTPSTTPGAPTIGTATGGNASATVSWTAPADNGGLTIDSYTVTASGGVNTCTWTTGPLSCSVSGLTNGTSYTFTVTAHNADGNGLSSAPSNAVTPSTMPGAPTIGTATGGNASATVSWTAPADNGGLTIDSYTVTSSPDGKTCTWSTGPLSCSVSGLTNGTSYTFTVTAHNTDGNSDPSAPSNAVTPSTTPGAPTIGTATGGNASATVSWTAPADNGGLTIDSYTVTASGGVNTCTWTTGPLSCSVSGLTNGTSYTFTVTAHNADGNGLSSAPSNAVTPSTMPDAPTILSADRGNLSAILTWTVPANNGSPITGYTVTEVTGDSVGAHPTCSVSPPATGNTCIVSGLTNGTTYTFTILATNVAGPGSPSAVSNSVVPSTVPSKPGTPTGVSHNGSVAVTWTAPASDGGAAIIGYTVTASPGLLTCGTTTALTCTVLGLTNDTPYTFTVTATNVAGSTTSDPSAAVTPTATVATKPGKPTVVPSVHQADVTWTAPTDNGGSPIGSYLVTSAPDGKSCVTSTGLTCTVTGLTNGQNYTFTVRAINVKGAGPASDASDPVMILTGGTYYPLTPTRLLDSRDGTGGLGIFFSHVAQTFQVTGRGGVPSGATAVTGNLTVTQQSMNGFLYMGPTAMDYPTSSTLNFPVGDDRANAVTVALGAGGTLSVTFAAPHLDQVAHVIFDVTGYFVPDSNGATYFAVTPTRVLDSRNGTGGTTIFYSRVAQSFQVTSDSGVVPTGALAVTGNLTVTQQTSNGFLYVGPLRADNPTSSTLNFPTNDDRANAVTVKLGAGGILWVTFAAPGYGPTAHVIFDVTGYFKQGMTGATFVPLTPTRLLDTRDGTGLRGAFSSHQANYFGVTGRSDIDVSLRVPSAATAVTGNLTVTQQTSLGFIYMGNYTMNNPTSSTLNFPAADDRANAVTVALGAGGVLWVTYAAPSYGPTAEIIFDVTGYFVP